MKIKWIVTAEAARRKARRSGTEALSRSGSACTGDLAGGVQSSIRGRVMNTMMHTNGNAAPAHPETSTSQLKVVVPYTTPELTRAALTSVAAMGGELGADVRLINAHVVPFPIPVTNPTVSLEFLDQRLYAAAEDLGLPVRMELLLTRDRLDAFRKALEPGSLVVIATRGWWWFSAEKKLARSLSKAGFDVMLVEADGGKSSVVRTPQLSER